MSYEAEDTCHMRKRLACLECMPFRVASPWQATTRERELHVALYISHAQLCVAGV